jgi:long-chain acyl-CoA synthetase
MQQEQDNEFTRAEEIRKLHVIPELVSHHLEIRGDDPAVCQFNSKTKEWETLSFKELYARSLEWANAFVASGLKKGDRVAMLLPNGIDAVCFDQGALIVGLVPVPLHIIDTPANCAYILEDSDTKLLVTVNRARWHAIQAAGADLSQLHTVVYVDDASEPDSKDVCCVNVNEWLKEGDSVGTLPPGPEEEDLAALVYTSGTTGKPKGVMLTHKNIMSDISALLYNIAPNPSDTWLSFLPLSHTFERTTSYYIGLGMGNKVTFSRGVARILDDLKTVRPSIMMSVPRVFEKVAAKINERLKQKGAVSRLVFQAAVDAGYRNFSRRNGLPVDSSVPAAFDRLMDPVYDKLVRNQIKNSFGGRMRVAVSGGAALSPEVAKTIIGLGIEIFQGYGMTETSPIISGNNVTDNDPATVGRALKDVSIRLGEREEIQIKGDLVMKGYWNREKDTKNAFTEDGWLKTGDQGAYDGEGRLKIVGRIKEILVTSTGEKISPVDIESALETIPLFRQTYAVGDGMPYIAVLISLDPTLWKKFAAEQGADPKDPESIHAPVVRKKVLEMVKKACRTFPAYAVPKNIALTLDEWTIDNGLLTPTLKLKRSPMQARYGHLIEEMYKGAKKSRI